MSNITPQASESPSLWFPSVDAFRVAHSKLLKRRAELQDESREPFWNDVAGFIKSGQATGKLLLADDERWDSQSSLDYWSTLMYRAGYTPPDATLEDFDPSLAPKLDESQRPYVGLESFSESMQDQFFGRQNLVDQIVKGLEVERWLSVVGPSGSGKSSLILAGVVPALKAGKAPGSEEWHYLPPIVPGSDPLANLASLVPHPGVNSAEWVQQQVKALQQKSHHLVQLINQAHTEPVLIICDQFEEIFTLTSDEYVRSAFIDNLLAVVKDPDSRHTVIITMRSDLEDYVAKLPELQAVFSANTARVRPLNAAELRDAIVKPAALAGLRFEEGIVEALIDEVLGEPAGLPLLQFTLLKLWNERQHNLITWEAFRRLGSCKQALTKVADEFYESLLPEDGIKVKRILLRLVRWGEGLEVFSNRVPRETLFREGESREHTERVLTRLIEAGLVCEVKPDASGITQVEVTHESLLRNWRTLSDWLEEDRVSMRKRVRLSAAAKQWDALGRDRSALWEGSLLDDAFRLEDLDALETLFVRKSRSKRTHRNWLIALAGVAILVAVLAPLYVILISKQRNQAISRQLAAQALNHLDGKLDLALLLSVKSFGIRDTVEARSSLLTAIEYSHHILTFIHGHTDSVRAIAFSPDQKTFASAGDDRTIRLWNIETRTEIGQLVGLKSPILCIAFDAEGKLLASGSEDGTVSLWSVADRKEIFSRLPEDQVQRDFLVAVAFTPDGKTLISGWKDGIIDVWDVSSGRMAPKRKEAEPGVAGMALSRDGTLALIARSDGTMDLWDVLKDQSTGKLASKYKCLGPMAFSPDGQTVAVSGVLKKEAAEISEGLGEGEHVEGEEECGDSIPTLELWRIGGIPQQIGISITPSSKLVATTFSRDGTTLIASNEDGVIVVWQIDGQKIERTDQMRTGHTRADSLATSIVGNLLISGSPDGTLTLLDLTNAQGIGHSLPIQPASVEGLAFSRDGQILASRATSPSGIPPGSENNSIILWSVAERKALREIPISNKAIFSLAFSTNGSILASGDDEGIITFWSVPGGAQITTLKVPVEVDPGDRPGKHPVLSIAFSPNGKSVASFANRGPNEKDNPIFLWDISTGKIVGQFDGHKGPINGLAFSPDGRSLASGGSGQNELYLWDVATFKPRTGDALLKGMQDFSRSSRSSYRDPPAVNALAFTPDGRYLVSGGNNNLITFWNAETGQRMYELTGHTDSVNSLSFSRDGKTLASGGTDRTIILWDVDSHQRLGQLREHVKSVRNIVFNLNRDQLASSDSDGAIILWDLNMESWRNIAMRIANRGLTDQEKELYSLK